GARPGACFVHVRTSPIFVRGAHIPIGCSARRAPNTSPAESRLRLRRSTRRAEPLALPESSRASQRNGGLPPADLIARRRPIWRAPAARGARRSRTNADDCLPPASLSRV